MYKIYIYYYYMLFFITNNIIITYILYIRYKIYI